MRPLIIPDTAPSPESIKPKGVICTILYTIIENKLTIICPAVRSRINVITAEILSGSKGSRAAKADISSEKM